jgi:hypothetical protein
MGWGTLLTKYGGYYLSIDIVGGEIKQMPMAFDTYTDIVLLLGSSGGLHRK